VKNIESAEHYAAKIIEKNKLVENSLKEKFIVNTFSK